jgi:hypothetical protein
MLNLGLRYELFLDSYGTEQFLLQMVWYNVDFGVADDYQWQLNVLDLRFEGLDIVRPNLFLVLDIQ